jgi:hypothetical protein
MPGQRTGAESRRTTSRRLRRRRTRFLVRWEIDLETTSAEEAARAALAIQRNPASMATFFTFRPHDNPEAEIELDLLDDDAAEPRPRPTLPRRPKASRRPILTTGTRSRPRASGQNREPRPAR